jgi:glycosyltransferase involved in cell wall biosynthesis
MKHANPFSSEEEVTAVIPAYNEANNIQEVLAVLGQVPALAHILVVDDGSEDETAVIVRQWQAKDERLILLSLDANQGKGNAMFAGAAARLTDLLLFIDADLKSLHPHHIEDLIRPVRQGKCAMSIGLFADGRWTTNLTHHLFPFLSGQRCLRWPLFTDLYGENINGWSIETAISLHARLKNYPVQYVIWPGVTHPNRTEKREGLTGYWSHIKMWWQIGIYMFHFLVNRRRETPAPAAQDRKKTASSSYPTLSG